MFRLMLSVCLVAVALVSGCNQPRTKNNEEPTPVVPRATPKTAATPKTEPGGIGLTLWTGKQEPKPEPKKPEPKKPEPKPETTLRDRMTGADERVSAPKLFARYEANGVEADSAFKGKKVCITGVVLKVANDVQGRPTIFLDSGGSPLNMVDCHVHKSQTEAVGKIGKGDILVIVGTGKGKVLGHFLLEDCYPIAWDSNAETLNDQITKLKEGK